MHEHTNMQLATFEFFQSTIIVKSEAVDGYLRESNHLRKV
jgi:hypothetical protein